MITLRDKLKFLLGEKVGAFFHDNLFICVSAIFLVIFKFIRVVSPEFNYIYRTEWYGFAMNILLFGVAPLVIYLHVLKMLLARKVMELAVINRVDQYIFKIRDGDTWFNVSKKEFTCITQTNQEKSDLYKLNKWWLFGQGHFRRFLYNKLEDTEKNKPEMEI